MPKKNVSPISGCDRLESNKEILIRLEDFLEANPDLRFIQALRALDIIEEGKDKFYEESQTTLKNIEGKIKGRK